MADPDYKTITGDIPVTNVSNEGEGGISATRQEYKDRVGIWAYNEDAYDNAGGFIDGTYLFQFGREEPEAFNRRKKICWMPNIAKDLADTLCGHLFKQSISRDVKNDSILENFIKSTNSKGDKGMTELMREAFMKSFVYEWAYVLVDKPKETFQTLRDENIGGLPYAYVLTAKDIVDWRKDEFDEYLWIKILESYVENEDDPLGDHAERTRYRIWTRETWLLYDSDGRLLEEGVHNLGRVPIVPIRCAVSIKNSDIGTSIYTSIVQTAVRLFNALSELDSLLVNGTFPILVIPGKAKTTKKASTNDTTNEKNAVSLGTGSTLMVPPDSRIDPQFISPDSSNTDAYYNLIDRLLKIMQTLARLDFTGGVKSSGVAMAFEFEKTNQSLLSKAETLKDAELAILSLVKQWMRQEPNTEVIINYPTDFNIRDMEKEIKQYFETLELDISKKFNKEVKKDAANKLLPNLGADKRSEIDKEIDEGDELADVETFVNEEEDGTLGEGRFKLSDDGSIASV